MTEIVDPTISDFEENPTSTRHAFLACVVTFQSIDYLTFPEKKAASRRKLFRGESPEFALIDRVAHAFKHAKTGHQQSDLQPLKAGEVVTRPPAAWGVAAWDLSRWDDSVGGVTIAGERGHDLLIVVRGAAEYLRKHIQKTVA